MEKRKAAFSQRLLLANLKGLRGVAVALTLRRTLALRECHNEAAGPFALIDNPRYGKPYLSLVATLISFGHHKSLASKPGSVRSIPRIHGTSHITL